MTASIRTADQHRSEYADFTEASYRELLRRARARYRFAGFEESLDVPHVLWRHDVDVSMQRARCLARIEHDEGAKATYFIHLRSLYYNVLNTDTHRAIAEIVALGHDIALHFDTLHYGRGLARDAFEEALAFEAGLLKREFGVRPTAVSFHLYGVLPDPMPEDDRIQGLVNAYSNRLRSTYGYVSDSNGVWLYRRLLDVLAAGIEERLQVLTHPEWWTPEVMPPRRRLQRAIDGYARAMEHWYDDTVERSGRPNLRD